MSLEAANPNINATVTASAGSGKTWMLTTRIVRLLLNGNEPGGILALTFTRKAAAEMQQRLAERLYELATVDNDALDVQLEEIGVAVTDQYRQKARTLYEFHQYCDYPVKTQTFHSFCQDILARFPLEADVPPGFNLLESSSLIIQQARDALLNEAALDMQGEVAQKLQALMQACDGFYNLEKSLFSFLHHRSDWWAFTEHATDPQQFACETLKRQLKLNPDTHPINDFFTDRVLADIKVFSGLLGKTGTKTNIKHADGLASILANKTYDQTLFDKLIPHFLTQKHTPIIAGRKDSASLRKKLGDAHADEFLCQAERLSEKILDTIERLNKQKTFELNRLWYYCGEKFIQHYQKLKQELRLLDFTDLEWSTYKLLQDSDNALWIQYKLDQRIDHLLIDEFQDTNPTQWHLILPLLEEMASGETERNRSVFLVGDEKQSIYSFRRAKPELQAQASDWLSNHLAANAFPLNKSWRSSPAIINSVNAIFNQDEFRTCLPNFSHHDTHIHSLPGKVEILPFLQAEETEVNETGEFSLRDPLETPRPEQASIYSQEGQQIANTIQQLTNHKTCIGEGKNAHAITYDDIFILVRKRSHVAYYENELRRAGIPYLGANKGTLMDCLEIRDMEALLDSLLTPFNNLAIAQVLKSPIFDASDEDLIQIAMHKGSSLWIDRIAELHTKFDETHPIHRAHVYIQRWRDLVDKVPVHDLLDRIYSEANLLARYKAAFTENLRPRVQANLIRFIELALELDSGRYPSLMHFLQHLRSLKSLVTDAPDEAAMESEESRVHIMTIHASKGLEAPVVFLADTINSIKDRSSYAPFVDWPVEEKQPLTFQLIPGIKNRDNTSGQYVEQQKLTQQRENANLLYVAITRAKQFLFVTGCLPGKKPYLDWYSPIKQGIQSIGTETEDGRWIYEFATIQQATESPKEEKPAAISIDPRLSQPLHKIKPEYNIIAPSQITASNDAIEGDEDGLLRGVIIHKCLELLTRNKSSNSHWLKQSIMTELNLALQDDLIDECIEEVDSLINDENLTQVFKPASSENIYNEVPIQYMRGRQMVLGIIDRLIVNKNKVLIIDYKSHKSASPENRKALAATYQQQMQFYKDGIKEIWPDKEIQVALLFTHFKHLHFLDLH